MTTPVEAVQQLCAYFEANFSESEIAFDNEPRTQRTEPFVRFVVQIGDSQPNLDSTFKRTVGVVIISGLALKGQGNLKALSLAQAAADVMQSRSIGGIRLTSAGYVRLGLVADGLQIDAGWDQVNANIPFWFEEYT